MTTRPDIVAKPPTWATDVTADKVDPGLAKQGEGWIDFEPLNNGHLNEMLNRYGNWIEYFDDRNPDTQNYIQGLTTQGVCVPSPTTLTVDINSFSGVVDGRQFDFVNPSIVLVPDPVNPTNQIIYMNPSGVISADVGVFIGGIAREASPLPTGALLCRVSVVAAAVNLAASIVLDYRKRSPQSPFMYLHEAFAQTADHEIADVWFKDYHFGDPGDTIIPNSFTFNGGGTKVADQKNTLAAPGDLVIMAGVGAVDPRATQRDLRSLTFTYTYAQVNTLGTRKIVSDGEEVAFIHDNFIEFFKIAGGAPLWSFDHGAAIYDVFVTPAFVYICGVVSAAKSIRKLNRTTGAEVASYDHGAEVRAIWSDDFVTHMMGPAGTGTFTFRILNSALQDATTDTTAEAVSIAEASTEEEVARFIEAPDGVVYRMHGESGVNKLSEHYKRRDPDLSTIGSVTGREVTLAQGTALLNVIDADQDYIFVANGGTSGLGKITCWDRQTMTRLWRADLGANDTIFGVATDGQRLFIDQGTPNSTVNVHVRGNRGPSSFMKFSDTTHASAEVQRTSMMPVKR